MRMWGYTHEATPREATPTGLHTSLGVERRHGHEDMMWGWQGARVRGSQREKCSENPREGGCSGYNEGTLIQAVWLEPLNELLHIQSKH